MGFVGGGLPFSGQLLQLELNLTELVADLEAASGLSMGFGLFELRGQGLLTCFQVGDALF